METLTVKEAIDQGYTKYGFSDKEWQNTQELHDDVFKEVEEENWEDLVLFGKESSHPNIDAKTIGELLSEHIGINDSEECARDDDEVYTTVSAMDFSDVAKKINKELEKHKYWMLTDIKLVQ